MLKGLYEIVPKDLLRIFSEKELELLISGLPEIDVDEWRANTGEWFCSTLASFHRLTFLLLTDLRNFSATDPVIGYFWRAVRSFTHEERAKVRLFSSSK